MCLCRTGFAVGVGEWRNGERADPVEWVDAQYSGSQLLASRGRPARLPEHGSCSATQQCALRLQIDLRDAQRKSSDTESRQMVRGESPLSGGEAHGPRLEGG